MQKQIEPSIVNAVRILGGVTETAKKIVAAGKARAGTMSPQNVQNWVARGYCPPRYAAWIEGQTGIPREYLVHAELALLLDGACDETEVSDA